MYSVLVNSCDAYRDCWDPFFNLFARHWPGCSAPIYLNTDTVEWESPPRPVTSLPTAMSGPRSAMNWAARTRQALERITTPLVLYLQEDYFLQAPVDGATVDAMAEEMVRTPEIAHIGLTHFGAVGPFEKTGDDRLWRISRESRYRISTQAGLWRRDHLYSCLRPGENVWMFEIFGTKRAQKRDDLYLTVNRDRFGPGMRVMEYLHTGIIKGQWHKDLPAVFDRFGISMDFAKRGFYRDPGPLLRRIQTASSLAREPKALLSALASLL